MACALIRQVNSQQSIIDHWTLGGGTAMMLQIDHRESRDIDLFLSDPQWLPFLDPQKHDFQFEIWPTDYHGDGSSFQKLAFKGIGEIDFIVGHAMTPSPTTQATIEGEAILLETIPEIITKKIYYPGSSIKPRDIFDIAAAGEQHADAVIDALQSYRNEVKTTLTTLDKLNPDFVNGAMAQLAIKDKYQSVAKTAFERTKEFFARYDLCAGATPSTS
jgi:Nucleotidyl transferase AbiEii toxin, Type IV TA system